MSTKIDPLIYRQAAIEWLIAHAGKSAAFAMDQWELVELERATADDDDYFWSGTKRFRVANPERFGAVRAVEPWNIQQPDVEPPPAEEPPKQMSLRRLAMMAAASALLWGGVFAMVALASGWLE